MDRCAIANYIEYILENNTLPPKQLILKLERRKILFGCAFRKRCRRKDKNHYKECSKTAKAWFYKLSYEDHYRRENEIRKRVLKIKTIIQRKYG